MCLTLPARVVAVDELGAAVETEGTVRRVLTVVVPETQVGDWVLVSAGSIVQRLDPDAATFLLATLEEANRLAAEEAASEGQRIG
jgi:hydrogenase assembly chaperone HypC/HupF